MFDFRDMERIRELAGKADFGSITIEEKDEMRTLMTLASPAVWDFPWDDLLRVAFTWNGIYSLAKLGRFAALRQPQPETAAADAS